MRLITTTDKPALGTCPEWMTEGICNQVDPELWFPPQGASTTARDAKRICMGCPVQQKCLDFAITNDERMGIWGGYSERERRRIETGRPIQRSAPKPDPITAQMADPSRTDPYAHGYYRYRRGCRCSVCAAGNAEYQRLYQAANGYLRGPRKRCQGCDAELHGKGRTRYCSTECKSLAYSGRSAKDNAA